MEYFRASANTVRCLGKESNERIEYIEYSIVMQYIERCPFFLPLRSNNLGAIYVQICGKNYH